MVRKAVFAVAFAAMVVLGVSLVAVILLYGSGTENLSIAYLTPRYYRLVYGLFASIILAGYLASELDAFRKEKKPPLYRAAAGRIRDAWVWLTLRSPYYLRLPIIGLLVAAFLFFIPPREDESITYISPETNLSIAGSPQLIADSRGADVSGPSRWRLGDEVFYTKQSGFAIGIISLEKGEVLWRGSGTYDTANDDFAFSEMLTRLPDDIVVLVISHGSSRGLPSDDFQKGLSVIGAGIDDKSDSDEGYVFVSARRNGHFSPVVELRGRHAIVAIDPNIAMRTYFLLRRHLKEFETVTLILILVLLVAAFARANHDTKWADAFKIAFLGGPILGSAVLWLLYSRGFLIVTASLSILGGTYLWYRVSFLKRNKPVFNIVIAAIVVAALSYPDFLARNHAFVQLLLLSAALYMAWRTYSFMFGAKSGVSYPFFTFFVTRIPLALIAYVSRLYLKGPPGSLREILAHWDSVYYIDIANFGYELSSLGGTSAFYPVFPWVVRSFRVLFADIIISGIVSTNLAFVVALCLLYRLVANRRGEEIARRSVLLLAVAPVSFFFSSIYTESTFLLLCLAFFSLVERRKWPQAGLCGILAVLTRSVGVILVPVGLWEYLKHIRFDPRHLRWRVAWILLIPLGLPLFAFIQYAQTGEMFASVQAQRAWERQPMQNPISVLVKEANSHDLNLWLQNPLELQVTVADGSCILAGIIVLTLIVPIARELGLAAALFVALGVFVPLSTGNSNSMLRYAHVLFPIFIWLGIKSERQATYIALIAVFLALGVFFTILHFNDFLLA